MQKLPIPDAFDNPTELASLASGLLDDFVKRRLDNIRVWFNNKGWTTSVGYVNAVNNLVLRASIEAAQNDLDADWTDFKDPSKYGISVINHPMNYTEKQLGERNM